MATEPGTAGEGTAGGAGAAAGTAEGQPQPWEGARSIEEAELLTPAAAPAAEEGVLDGEEEEDLDEAAKVPAAAKPGEKPAEGKPKGEGEGEEKPPEGEEAEDEEEEEAGEEEDKAGEVEEEEPAFDPKAHGLDPQAYAGCKTLGEALALAERRRRDQELRADRQAGELGATRKRLTEIEKEATDAAAARAAAEAGGAAGPLAPAEWTEDQKRQVIEAWETNPQEVVAWIQAPFVKAIDGFKETVSSLERKIAELTGRVHSTEGAPYEVQAQQEWDAFVVKNPDAAELFRSGTLERIGKMVNADVPDDRQRWDYATVFGLAKAETERPGEFGRLVELVRMGHSLEEASEILANARRATELAKTKRENAAQEVKRKRGLAGGGGGPAPGTEPVTAIGIQNL